MAAEEGFEEGVLVVEDESGHEVTLGVARTLSGGDEAADLGHPLAIPNLFEGLMSQVSHFPHQGGTVIDLPIEMDENGDGRGKTAADRKEFFFDKGLLKILDQLGMKYDLGLPVDFMHKGIMSQGGILLGKDNFPERFNDLPGLIGGKDIALVSDVVGKTELAGRLGGKLQPPASGKFIYRQKFPVIVPHDGKLDGGLETGIFSAQLD